MTCVTSSRQQRGGHWPIARGCAQVGRCPARFNRHLRGKGGGQRRTGWTEATKPQAAAGSFGVTDQQDSLSESWWGQVETSWEMDVQKYGSRLVQIREGGSRWPSEKRWWPQRLRRKRVKITCRTLLDPDQIITGSCYTILYVVSRWRLRCIVQETLKQHANNTETIKTLNPPKNPEHDRQQLPWAHASYILRFILTPSDRNDVLCVQRRLSSP